MKLAREAKWSGLFVVHMSELGGEGFPIPKTKEQLERFAALIVEECAKVCDEQASEAESDTVQKYTGCLDGEIESARFCAAAIRQLVQEGK